MALATPPGIGALHVIRMSGERAFEIINALSLSPVNRTEDRIQVTFLKSRNNQLIDQVVLSKFYAPHSYTGEDCIEISCHGNNLISKLIIDELLKCGAVYAERGEFTKRAFLNNKIDLNQAINIGNLFQAKTEVDIYSSINEIRGASSALINNYINELLNIIAECEINIDYPADIEKDDPAFLLNVRSKIKTLFDKCESLLNSSKKQKLSGYRVVLIGKPNAGKSSLINYLIGKDRVLVSDKAGTTQDAIEVDYFFENYLITLVDTAGIDSKEDYKKYLAAQKSKQEAKAADLIIHLIASDQEESAFLKEEIGDKACLTFFSKADLVSKEGAKYISVKNENIKALEDALREHLKEHYTLVGIKSQEGINHLNNATLELEKSLAPELPLDLIAEHLSFAHEELSKILKLKRDNFEKINHLFDNFCVGK